MSKVKVIRHEATHLQDLLVVRGILLTSPLVSMRKTQSSCYYYLPVAKRLPTYVCWEVHVHPRDQGVALLDAGRITRSPGEITLQAFWVREGKGRGQDALPALFFARSVIPLLPLGPQ